MLSKFIGLRFSRRLNNSEVLLIINNKKGILSSGIDMLFVFFSIDVFWLDESNVVVDKRNNVKPFSLPIFPKKPAKYILETMPNAIKAEIGSKINFKSF